MRLTKEKEQIIRVMYANKKTPTQIGSIVGIHPNSVIRWLRKHDINRNQLIRVSDQEKEYIIIEYRDKKRSSESIAFELEIDGTTVCRILRKANIEIRSAEEAHRKYEINENIFENIDNEEKAYWLGFLYADGTLSKRGYSIKLELHPKDKDVLEKFSTMIYGFVKIGHDPHENNGVMTDYLYVAIYSKKMHKDLTKLGCSNNKTFTLTFPTFLQQNLVRHFIRGYLDGDGCICTADENRPRVDFTSNKDFIEGLVSYIENNLGFKCNKIGQRHENTETRNIQIMGFEKVKILLDHLYKNATIFMERKKQKYYEVFEQSINKDNKKIVKHSDVNRYGTIYIPSFSGTVLTQNNLKKMSQKEKDNISKYLLDFYRDNGFPYPTLTNDEIIKEFTVLKNVVSESIEKDKILGLYNQAGISIFKHFSPHFYEVNSGRNDKRKSILETFNDDRLLLKVIENRLKFNYNMTGNMLKQGLPNSKIAYKASIFFPTIAKFIYTKYTKENNIIYDYSMGFGQRLLGALSLPHKIKYVGVDPLKKSVESNNNIFQFLKEHVPGISINKQIDLQCIGSETFCPYEYIGKINVAFSSPPYFNLESYSEDSSQAYSDNNYDNFLNKWWKQTVSNIDKLLADDGVFILNVKEKIGDDCNILEDMSNIISENGFVEIDRYHMQLTRNTTFGNKKNEHKYEPIVVFGRK